MGQLSLYDHGLEERVMKARTHELTKEDDLEAKSPSRGGLQLKIWREIPDGSR